MEKLTELKIKNIKQTEKEYYIRESNGFVLRVQKPCSRTFCYIFDFAGKRCRMVLGSYPATTLAEAREKHMQAQLLLKKGIDPRTMNASPALALAESETEIFTVSKLVELYIEYSERNKATKTALEDKRILQKHIVPEFGSLPAADLKRRDAIKLIDKVAETAPGTARAIMKIARAMYTRAIDLEYTEVNPFSGVSRAVPAVRATERDRVLSDAEIKAVWSVLADPKADIRSEFTRKALLLVLVTGQRPGEVAGMQFSELSGDWWTIPADRSKNGIASDVYLTPLAQKLIGQPFQPKYRGSVFPGPGADMQSIERAALSHYVAKNKTLKKMSFTPHDLRRTCATNLSKLGCMDEIVDAVLNHQKTGVIKIYNRHKYANEKQEWLTRWSKYLLQLVA